VTKEECDWIKHSFCAKWLFENCKFSPKPTSILEFLRILKDVRNLQRRKESHSDTERILFY
jgi:hypothetical protein